MATKGRAQALPQPDTIMGAINQELAQAFSDAVFGLLEHNCSCPSAKFVKLLVRYRKTAFKEVTSAIPNNSAQANRLADLSDTG